MVLLLEILIYEFLADLRVIRHVTGTFAFLFRQKLNPDHCNEYIEIKYRKKFFVNPSEKSGLARMKITWCFLAQDLCHGRFCVWCFCPIELLFGVFLFVLYGFWQKCSVPHSCLFVYQI